MTGVSLAYLESQLDDEEAEQWLALLAADERVRAANSETAEIAPRVNSLSARERPYTCGCGEENCEYDERAAGAPLSYPETLELCALRSRLSFLSDETLEASKAKAAPAKWLEERGLLDGLWRALWAERHVRGER